MKINDLERLQKKAEIFQSLGQPIRLGIVELLRDGEMCVCDIAERIGAERSNISRHLSVLERASVLGSRKDGQRVLYRLRAGCVLDFLSCVTEMLRNNIACDVQRMEQ